jgi:N-formylglutamate amidohydrolase
VGTLELAKTAVKRLSETLGHRPFVVAARFSRKYIDVNRAEPEAFETPEAKPVYWAYHNRIRDFISEIRKTFPAGGLLLDIHGQSTEPGRIHRGTRNGLTVTRLIQRHGSAAVTGQQSILGYLASKGYRVFPSSAQIGDPPEHKRYVGGYTVSVYGSHHEQGIDAIQIEIGKEVRAERTLADDLSQAIAVFYRTYLTSRANPL